MTLPKNGIQKMGYIPGFTGWKSTMRIESRRVIAVLEQQLQKTHNCKKGLKKMRNCLKNNSPSSLLFFGAW